MAQAKASQMAHSRRNEVWIFQTLATIGPVIYWTSYGKNRKKEYLYASMYENINHSPLSALRCKVCRIERLLL